MCFKTAVIKPLLKKPKRDPKSTKNYRPVSNLPFISKLLEHVVMKQLVIHLNDNHLLDKFQSACHAGFSTETAFLWVTSDLLCSVNDGKLVLLTLLDLSAAFDTSDHGLPLQQLEFEDGIKGSSLAWFFSYLAEHCQHLRTRCLLTLHDNVVSPKALCLAPTCSPFTLQRWDRSWTGTRLLDNILHMRPI